MSKINGSGDILDKDTLWTVFSSFIKETSLSRQHLDSYNAFVKYRMKRIIGSVKEITPEWRRIAGRRARISEITMPDVKVVIGKLRIEKPMVKEAYGSQHRVLPMECRIRNISYMAPLFVEMKLIIGGKEVDSREVKIGDFPVMIRSEIDPLSKFSPSELIEAGEDPYDPGGYFIINGSEKVVVVQEDLAVNRIIVGPSTASTAKITHTAKVVSTVLGLRRQIIVDRMSDGSLEVSISRLSYRIPFAILMKALGLEKDVEIGHAVSADDEVLRELLPSLNKVALTVRTREEALEFIGNRLAPGQPREIRIARAEEFLDKQFLPHLGDKPEDRRKKAYFLAEMANRVLQLYLGKRPADDKDHYSNKRLRLAGDLIAEIFREGYNALVNVIRNQLEEYISQRHRSKPKLNYIVRADILTERLRSALATGNWGRERTGVSQALDRTNWISLLSHLRRVISPLSRGQIHFEARDLHGTHWGRLCPFETPEGINCGLVKNLALMSYISVGVDESEIEKLLYDLGVIPLDELIKEAVEAGEAPEIMRAGTKVFLNGRPIGFHENGAWLAEELRRRRRRGELSYEVGVAHIVDEYINELYINTDEGRLMRPVIVVENGKPKLTKEHAEKLRRGEISFWDLVREGVIELLDPDEEENAYIAEFPEDVTPDHTHLELWVPAIVGVAAATIPFLEHNQSPRNTYQSAMAKQALGLYALNYKYRTDSHAYLLHYPQKPIVQTRMLSLMGYNERPSGQNMIVALMATTGYNIEDALVFNKTSVDYGLARAFFYRVYTAVENVYSGGAKDRITVPSPKLYDHKGDQYYTKLGPDGIVEPEVEVRGGDILVGRESPPRFMGEERVISPTAMIRRDTSIQLRFGEKGVIDTVFLTQTTERQKLVKIRVRDLRIPEIGDKFASRHGQKGVIGILLPRYDMPYTEDGIVPDVILNPHAIPSRMTVGQLLETIAGKIGAIKAKFIDGTPFFKDDIEQLRIELLKAGYDPNAREVMYDGRTGRLIEKPVAIGVTFYQRLYHMVSDKMHARATGKVQLLTRQPTEGKARQGGLRFGEMERDCLVGHGAVALLRDRLLYNSDRYTMYVCTKCGHIAWYNRRKGVYECPIHGEEGDIKPVTVPYAFKLLLQEVTSMMIKPEIKVMDKINILEKILQRPVESRVIKISPKSNGGEQVEEKVEATEKK
ncbi:MAG: DNA-directed RNA polymerase subunit B [Desulfurococcales archaeon]|nr:DNA-directed RNA polymerase subunit B [Desulfurococcales archaeon]